MSTTTLYPYKLTRKELEARLQSATPLLPGQFIRFDGPPDGANRAFGEITGVRTLPDNPEATDACLVRVRLLHGAPTMAPQTVTLLNDDQMAHEVQRMLGDSEHPLRLGEAFTGEFERLGALTLITGEGFEYKYDALMMLMSAIEPYQRLLIIDPLGLFSDSDPLDYHRAGEDLRLSLQQVGVKRFLDAMGELFPQHLREPALRTLAERLPSGGGFISFSQLLNLHTAEFSLKPLILQSLHAAVAARVFADMAEQVMTLQNVAQGAVSVLDLSGMPEPWKSLFYEEVCHEIYGNAGGDIVPVLIYPENYLADPVSWVQKADEAELNLIMLGSPYTPNALVELADNQLHVEVGGRVYLIGGLTGDLPVRFPLPESVLPAASAVRAAVPTPAYAPIISEGAPAGIVRPHSNQPVHIVDLQAPRPESRLPLPGPVSADMPMSEVELEPEPQPLSPDELMALMSGFQPQHDLPESEVAEEAPALDYPDADEGAAEETRPQEPPARVRRKPKAEKLSSEEKETAPLAVDMPYADVEEPAAPAEAAVEASDDFSFDVNLDQKMGDAWSSDWSEEETPEMPLSEAMSSRMTQNMEAFEEALPAGHASVDWPAGPVPEQPEAHEQPAVSSRWEPDDFPSGRQSQEVIEDDMVPIIPKAAATIAGDGFQAGDRVRHETYGLGIVNKVVPMEHDVILNITFESVGKRLLDPARCKLTREAG